MIKYCELQYFAWIDDQIIDHPVFGGMHIIFWIFWDNKRIVDFANPSYCPNNIERIVVVSQ